MFESEPQWLPKLLNEIEQQDLDEIILRGDGFWIATRRQKTWVHKQEEKRDPHLTREVQEFSLSQGLRLDPRHPFSGGLFESKGYRWQAVIPPMTQEATFILRKHRMKELNFDSFALKVDQREAIEGFIERGLPLLILGGTGTGKTSFLSALLSTYFLEKRVTILEDYEELLLLSPLWLRLLSRCEGVEGGEMLNQKKLFREALRLRPDHLVLGELRDEEVGVFLQACQSGHGSAFGTFHAGSLEEFKRRLNLILGERYSSTRQLLTGFKVALIIMEVGERGTPQVKKLEEFNFS